MAFHFFKQNKRFFSIKIQYLICKFFTKPKFLFFFHFSLMKFRVINLKQIFYFFCFFPPLTPGIPLSYAAPNSDSLLDLIRVKKSILQQQILRKNNYLSQNFGINYVTSPKFIQSQESPQSIQQNYPPFTNPMIENKPQNIPYLTNYYNNDDSSDRYNFHANPNQNYPSTFYSNTQSNQNTQNEENIEYGQNPLKNNINEENFQNEQRVLWKKPPNLDYYNQIQNPANEQQMKNQKNTNNFRFIEKNPLKKKEPDPSKNTENNKIDLNEIVKEIKSEIERKMLMEITSNFSHFSDNINHLVQQVGKISNETMKSTEIEKNLLKKAAFSDKNSNEIKQKEEEIQLLKESFQEIKNKEKEKNEGFNVSLIQDLISGQIENQFKRYFTLIPKPDILKEYIDNKTVVSEKIERKKEEEENKNRSIMIQNEVLGKIFNKIDKMDKWQVFEEEKERNKEAVEYFSYLHKIFFIDFFNFFREFIFLLILFFFNFEGNQKKI